MIKIYFKLALNAIKKNRVLFLPYIVATSLVGIVFYLITSLSLDKYIRSIHGGYSLTEILLVGKFVIALFTSIFILYLNMFISRKRKTEYGVLSVLGMEKKHLVGLVLIENLILFIITLLTTVIGGNVFYKVYQLGLLKTVEAPIDKSFVFIPKAVAFVSLVFLGTYVLTFIIQSVSLVVSKTINVIKASSRSERKRIIDYFVGVLGFALLIYAYITAINMPSVIANMSDVKGIVVRFATDVVFVIVATFLVFSAGSAVILSGLRKIKSIYYKKNNFINISGLAFRMRRNGLGLASICILFTMVIVSCSGLISFYSIVDPYLITGIKANAIVNKEFRIDHNDSDNPEDYRVVIIKTADEYLEELINEAEKKHVKVDYRYLDFMFDLGGVVENDTFYSEDCVEYKNATEDDIYSFVIVLTQEEVETFTGKKLDLEPNQIGIIASDIEVISNDGYNICSKIKLNDDAVFDGIRLNDDDFDFVERDHYTFFVVPMSSEEICEVTGFNDKLAQRLSNLHESFEVVLTPYNTVYYVDINADYATQKEIFLELGWITEDLDGFLPSEFYQAPAMIEFYTEYRGLIYVAFSIIVVFIIISILVLYYKNVFDAYEDLKNFQIMKKVGLEDSLVKKTVYSQMLVSTLLPIILAAIHTLFAESFIKSLLSLFDLSELQSFRQITLFTTLIFIVIYVVIGIFTGRVYVGIVGKKEYQ